MASVLAIGALVACGIFEEVPAEGTAHDIVKLLLYELVPVHLMDLFFACANGAFAPKTKIQRPLVIVQFHFLRSVSRTVYIQEKWNLPKLNASLICPTGSNANQASMTGA